MDTRVRKLLGHPMPEMATFVSGQKAAFGDAVARGKGGDARGV